MELGAQERDVLQLSAQRRRQRGPQYTNPVNGVAQQDAPQRVPARRRGAPHHNAPPPKKRQRQLQPSVQLPIPPQVPPSVSPSSTFNNQSQYSQMEFGVSLFDNFPLPTQQSSSSTQPPSTQPPSTQPPSTQPPSTQPPSTQQSSPTSSIQPQPTRRQKAINILNSLNIFEGNDSYNVDWSKGYGGFFTGKIEGADTTNDVERMKIAFRSDGIYWR